MENLQEPKTDLSKNFTFKEKTNNSNEKEPENKVSVILDPLPENDDNIEINDKMPKSKRNQIFCAFLLSTLFLNYDTGVIPASLLEILKEIPLDYREQALIGSLVYLGLSFASLFVSLLFNKFGASKVNATMLILNSLCCFVFSFSSNKYVLYMTRFLMGVSEAFIVIYAPVWVNNYSPANSSTTWMGILHSFTAIGVMFGYLLSGLIINFLSNLITWRFSVRIQGIAEIPLAIYFYLENEEYINISLINNPLNKTIEEPSVNVSQDVQNIDFTSNPLHNQSISRREVQIDLKIMKKSPTESNLKPDLNPKITEIADVSRKRNKSKTLVIKRLDTSRIDTIEMNNLRHYCLQAREVLTNYLYIFVTFGLCSMYFIVTGIQFWMTSYLIEILGNDPIIVMLSFAITSITAPLGGVIVGGTFADRYGGYKGKNSLKALKLCSAFGVVSFVFSFPLGFLYSIEYITVLLWAFLFFGAAIVPIGTGIAVSAVRRYNYIYERDCQATSSSISQLIINLFGYFSSPILTGMIMDSFKDKHQGYKWGMRLIFWWSIFACFFLSCAWIVAYNRYKEGNEKEEKDLLDDLNQNMVDLVKLEVIRRMAQGSSAF